jgi:signal transduction histidine kinase
MTAAAIILTSIVIFIGLRQVADQLESLTEAVSGITEGEYSDYLGDTDNPFHRIAHTLHMMRRVVAPTHGELEERSYDLDADISPAHDDPVPLLERISYSLEWIEGTLRQMQESTDGGGQGRKGE